MKQVLENFKTGECIVEEVPPPIIRDNFVLVKNHYSLISTGTEGGTVKLGKMSLLGKARARPDQAMKVIQVAKTQGLMVAYNAAMRSLEMPILLGYCTAGEVIDVGKNVNHVKVGDKVACAGAGFANHAEVVCIPKNLCVLVPVKVEMRHAAFTTLGSIALQSVRIADARLGENIIVIGLGLVGLLTVQLLRAAGCRVFGIDIDSERVDYIKRNDFGDAELNDAENLKERVNVFTSGKGADAIIITAATENNGPVSLAGELARQKGRVVAVGRTKLEAPRETYLFKELELRTSMAYGPGTGDPSYELDGIDYPYGYVRWTEGRNMSAVLELIHDGSLQLETMVSHEFNIDDASEAFELITGKTKESSSAVLLKYTLDTQTIKLDQKIQLNKVAKVIANPDTIRTSVIGAGSFATNELLPLLAKQKDIAFNSIASARGVNAKALGKKYGFLECTSDSQSIIEDNNTNCVFILTRHDTHAALATAALRSGKHVFVEKPLALTHAELDEVEEALHDSGCQLMVGFNRRYAPLAIEMKEYFGERAQPMSISYCANVGYRPPEHWLHNPKQGGGVVLGEACHHIDFCNWFIGMTPIDIMVKKLESNNEKFLADDNVHITLQYPDSSLAHIAYLSNGSKAYLGERVEIFCDNKVASIKNYKKLELTQGLSMKTKRLWVQSDKGHTDQIRAFLDTVSGRGSIDIDSYIASSRVAIDVAMKCKGL